MSSWKYLWIIPVLVIPGGALVVGLVGGYLYVKRQGYFDPPLVRFARAMSANDVDSVTFAGALIANRTAAWKTPWFVDGVGWQFEPNEIPNAIAIMHAMSVRGLPQMADFDWKEGGEPVADAFEDMLAHYDLTGPTEAERSAILKEAEEFGPKYSQIPILIARYDRYFRQSGYLLADLNSGSDAYQFVALPPKTAKCWKNVSLPSEPGRLYDDALVIEAAIAQSRDFINDRAPDMKGLSDIERSATVRQPPSSACLPFWIIF